MGVQFLRDSSAHSAYAIGAHSYGVDGSPYVFAYKKSAALTIGAYCSFAEGSKILLAAEHRPDWISTYPMPFLNADMSGLEACVSTKGGVVIGNDVWVGMDATILSGVSVGDGAVIGTCAVVTKDVEPYAIMAGNPARCIRHRFAPDVCAALERVAWWNWPIEKIKEAQSLLLSPDIRAFLDYAKEHRHPLALV